MDVADGAATAVDLGRPLSYPRRFGRHTAFGGTRARRVAGSPVLRGGEPTPRSGVGAAATPTLE